MSHIFLSYSRKNSDFVFKIVDSLEGIGLDIWVDKEDIPKGVDWEQKIYRGIEEADAFLFMISPDSVTSEICGREIAHARKNNKRIIPVLIRDTDPKTTHAEISKINWIYCREERDNLDSAIEEIDTTIHTNFAWVEFHTKLQTKALAWEERKDNSRLLRGNELKEAEKRLGEVRAPKDPLPTDLMRQYVLKSRQVNARLKKISSATVFITVLFVILWNRTYYRFWRIPTAPPAIPRITLEITGLDTLPPNIATQLNQSLMQEYVIKPEQTTLQTLPDSLLIDVSNFDNDEMDVSINLPVVPAYKLDFLPEIRGFGEERINFGEVARVAEAAEAYSVGRYRDVIDILEGTSSLSGKTLLAQAFLFEGEFDSSLAAYEAAIKLANAAGKDPDQLHMGAALALWSPNLSQYKVSSLFISDELASNCAKAHDDHFLPALAGGHSAHVDWFLIHQIAAHYCGATAKTWTSDIQYPDISSGDPALYLFALTLPKTRMLGLNAAALNQIALDLERSSESISMARMELVLHYYRHSNCDAATQALQNYESKAFTKLDKDNTRYLLQNTC